MPGASRTKSRYLLLWALLTGCWSLAHAADPPAGTARDCRKIDDYREMVSCFAATAGAADAELAQVYDSLMGKLAGSTRRDLLASSQTAWLAYRAPYCALVSSAVEGGSFQPTMRNICQLDLTRARIKELEHQLNCREGDMGCVVPNRRP